MSTPVGTKESGYVPGFEEDVFISYGHVDNVAPSQGWISHLHEQLEGRLKQLLGEGATDVRVWRDRKLDGLDDLEDVLQRKTSRSALFLSVLSPRYVASPSCAKEVNWFLEATRKHGGMRVDSKSRIVRVLKTPLQGAAESAGLREIDTLGFRFYKEEDEDFSEFPANPVLPGYADFLQQSEKLAKAINHLLRRMRKEKQEAVRIRRPRTVFLAETTKELKQFSESIRSELTERGHRVLPEANLPTDCRDELETAIQALLPSCDISVHLLGQHYGKVPEGEETHSVARLQYDWIREHWTEQAFQQLLWIPEDLTDPEPRQEEFLKSLLETKDRPGEVKVEVFKTGLASFKEGLLDILAKEPRPAAPMQSKSKSKSIYLLCDQHDLTEPQFQEIRGYLLNQGYPIDLPAFEGDPGELRQAEKMSVCENDATVIYYGNAKDLWVKLKRKALLSLLAETGKRSTRALYLSIPENDMKKGVYLGTGGMLPEPGGFSPLLVLGDCGPFLSEKVRPLLDRLEMEEPC